MRLCTEISNPFLLFIVYGEPLLGPELVLVIFLVYVLLLIFLRVPIGLVTFFYRG